MKLQHTNPTGQTAARFGNVITPIIKPVALFALAVLALFSATPSLQAQGAFRFTTAQLRVTVPVGWTNSTVISNNVTLVGAATNANFDVSGLPTNAAAVLTDINGNPLTSITNSAEVVLTLNTTNISEGLYFFNLNAGGFDTNGNPVTNSMPFVLQSAHVWYGAGYGVFGVSNNWANASSWLGGVPAATDDVVFADSGAQTNGAVYMAGQAGVDNVGIDTSLTVASIRFAQSTFTNSPSAFYHSIRLATNVVLSVVGTNAAGTNGFSLLRDAISDFGTVPFGTMGVDIYGPNSALVVSNANANFSILLGNSEQPTMTFSNLGAFVTYVSRLGIADFRAYPNYVGINQAFNGGRSTNNYAGFPRRLIANVFLARTNYLKATYADPNNYNNEFTRTYSMTLQNNEQSGNGSSTTTYFYLGRTNVFDMDSVCFIGSSSASGNNGGTKFSPYPDKNATNPGVVFRNVDGVSRMSMFCVSDDGGTNGGNSNVKSTIDFTDGLNTKLPGTGYIDLLADRLYVARDRTMIASNASPNVQGDLIFGSGIVDVNTAYLGCQEHSNKVDWTTLGGAAAYLNYCQGRLVVTNGVYTPTVVKINRNLTLGYTGDINPAGSAQQYNTYGQVTIYSNCTMQVSNIICDGGLNFWNSSFGRQNIITINRGGTLIVSNTIGYPNPGADDTMGFSAAGPSGMYLDTLTMTAAKLGVFVNPSYTNVFVRNLSTPGLIPSVLKIEALTGVSAYPAQIPIINYVNPASPFIVADVSTLPNGPYYGYIINNSSKQTVDLYVTTNSPNNLIWTGAANNNWDTTSLNWVTTNGAVTNFSIGDIVTFNDSSMVTNINISGSVIPSQSGVGVTISNSVNQYIFSGGTIAGTALISKQGTNVLEFDTTEQGPILLTAGSVTNSLSGQMGTTTVYSNVVLNCNGNINGGLTSTGLVTFAGIENGPISIGGGYLVNSGTMSTPAGAVVTMVSGTAITNTGTINVGSGTPNQSSFKWDVPFGSTLANFGLINLYQPQLSVEGLLFGNGTISYPNGGGLDSIANTSDPRVVINPLGVLHPGSDPVNGIGSMNMFCRFDFNNDPSAGQDGVAGVSTVRINVDFSKSPSNDVINCDRWNNDTGYLLMTSVNPGFRSFTLGDTFQVLANSSGAPFNFIDTLGFCPTIIPYVPGPGLQWGVTNFNLFGSISVTNSPMIWSGGDGNWNTNGTENNWQANSLAFADNQGAVFDDRGTVTTVNLNSDVAPEGYPSVTVTNIVVGVSTNIVVTTNQPAFYPGIVVSNAVNNYVIAGTGHIRGPTGLYKTGPGTLTLLTSNVFFGNVIVDNGTLAISNYNALANIVSLGIQGGGQMENDIILDGGTLNYVGLANVGLSNGKNSYPVFNANGGTIGVASSTNTLTINKFASGPGSLTKVGPGTLQLSSTTDDYQGGTIVNAGNLLLSAAAAGYGGVTLNNATTLALNGNFTLTNSLNLAGPATTIQMVGTSADVLSGNWTGSGFVTVSNNNPLALSGDLSGFSGTVSFGNSAGVFQFNNATNKNPCTGSAAATFNLGTGSAVLGNFNGGGLTYNLGALAGGANTVLTGRGTNSASVSGTTYSIGANGASTTFAGKITNGLAYNGTGPDVVSVTKVGAGSLWLNGASTYTGATTVSSGTLGGTGSITSPLTVAASGTLAPGTSATSLGTFTVNNSVTLGGTVYLKLNRANSPATNDMLAVTGTLTGGGALIVTNIGPDIYNGSKFTLFSKPVTGFTSIVLPTNNPANTSTYTWNNTLASDGSITLVSGGSNPVNTNPTNVVATVTNGVLTLTWPVDHTGWRLQVQTNPLASGLGSNWFTVPSSTNVNTESFNMDVHNGSVFYRLIYP